MAAVPDFETMLMAVAARTGRVLDATEAARLLDEAQRALVPLEEAEAATKAELAAAEAAVALAIALNFYNNHLTIDVDRGNELHG